MMRIRKIASSDLRALAKLDAEVFGDTSEKQALVVFRDLTKTRISEACLLAEVDGDIIGAIFTERKITFTTDSAYIGSVFVKKEWQGKGVGKTLMDRCLEALKKKGVKNVSLTVAPKNRAAILLYKKYGFKLHRLLLLKRF
ncbi:MAG: GNAT family N-acetyltransferase [Candidatus ainarchaeum sp.]|nr:GNAT family N-acetyltransferase [Candidatus ainarchaeum sp.]